MFNLPVETFWLIVPWPFVWVVLAVIMYFKMKKEDDEEERYENQIKE